MNASSSTANKRPAQTQIKSEPAAQPAAGVFNFGLKNKDAKATIIASTTTVDKKGEQMVKKGAALLVKGSINITNGAARLSPEEMAKAATSKEAATARDFSEPRILVNSSATAVAVDAARGLIFVAFKDRTVRLLSIEVTGEAPVQGLRLEPDQRLELVREVPFGADAAAFMPCPSVPSLQLLAVRDGLTGDWDVAEMAATTPPGTCQTCAPYVRPLAADFQALLGTADGADVTLVVGPDEKEFRAHRAVLLARCAFFRPFLLGGFYVRVERDAQHVPRSDLLETAAAADRFMLFEFRNALLARATAAMTPGTFVQTLALFRRLAAPPPEELMRAALRYYVDNQEPILRDHEASVGALIAQEPGLVLELLGAEVPLFGADFDDWTLADYIDAITGDAFDLDDIACIRVE
ncbi:hypothetical protein HYH03_018628 [Edaphochlamys debaryana]|uniref:BTB domain-containing protein n=1 Tax=Edaphochlamys debaryana TaxID=47281 RepID=A0A836BP64_9CHLO|nr:hypothetical protein HYH03_018628 [Edaphochlamys debaryana]|eukprot:KAG2482424.1 hypothetical protein HYH03_018628 [Edaphochlamys debaryana]